MSPQVPPPLIGTINPGATLTLGFAEALPDGCEPRIYPPRKAVTITEWTPGSVTIRNTGSKAELYVITIATPRILGLEQAVRGLATFLKRG